MADPKDLNDEDFPSEASSSQKLLYLSKYAVLAPSVHNTQPWIFKIVQNSLYLCIDRTRQLPIADPDARQLLLSCGAALDHLVLAMRKFGMTPIISLQPSPLKSNHIATITVGKSYIPTNMEEHLFKSMKSRYTSRSLVYDKPISSQLANDIDLIASSAGFNWTRISTKQSLLKVQKLIRQADSSLYASTEYREEMFAWINGISGKDVEGMSVERLEMLDLTDVIKLLESYIPERDAHNQSSTCNDGYLLGLLTTDNDDPSDWISAGQVLSRVLLRSALDGFSATFLNQPIDAPAYRELLVDSLGINGYPQYMLLFGQSLNQTITSRRGLSSQI